MNTFRRCLLPVCGLILLAGCETSGQTTQLEERCMEPRAQVCTREYRPVCGLRDTGEWQEYGNGCTACADSQVLGYTLGQCSAPAE